VKLIKQTDEKKHAYELSEEARVKGHEKDWKRNRYVSE
jgi:hypothetical protein